MNEQKRFRVLGILIVLLLLGGWWFLVGPKFEELTSQRAKLRDICEQQVVHFSKDGRPIGDAEDEVERDIVELDKQLKILDTTLLLPPLPVNDELTLSNYQSRRVAMLATIDKHDIDISRQATCMNLALEPTLELKEHFLQMLLAERLFERIVASGVKSIQTVRYMMPKMTMLPDGMQLVELPVNVDLHLNEVSLVKILKLTAEKNHYLALKDFDAENLASGGIKAHLEFAGFRIVEAPKDLKDFAAPNIETKQLAPHERVEETVPTTTTRRRRW